MTAVLTYHGRRVLAHLPTHWGEKEDELVAHEIEACGESIRSYDLATFTARLAEDPFTFVEPEGTPRPLSAEEVRVSLEGLVADGLAEVDGDGEYRMTAAGRSALERAELPESAQVPGAVTVELAPAQLRAGAMGEVES